MLEAIGDGPDPRWRVGRPAIRGAAGELLSALIALGYPDVCARCGVEKAGALEGYVCGSCRDQPGHLRWIRGARCDRCGLPYDGEVVGAFVCGNCDGVDLAFDRARAAVVATPFLLDLVHRYKYRGALWHEPFLAGLRECAAGAELRAGGWDALVPVPLHPLKRREREFNQAERLALRLGRETGIPVRSGWVRRLVSTQTQALLRRGDRAHNVAHAFACRPGLCLAGGRIVVVDDVLTTGATTSAVSRVLRAAGAIRVEVWTVARGV